MPINLAPDNPYGLELRSPVLVAAGCFGYGAEYARVTDSAQLGAIVTTSTSLRPRRLGQQQLIETPAGLLWSGGANPGFAGALKRYAAFWAASPTPIIMSIVGQSAPDYAELAGQIEGVEGIAGLELVLPDEPALIARIIHQVRENCGLPLLAKLPFRAVGLEALVLQAVAAGADVLVLPAGRPGLVLLSDGQPLSGMLCGPALRPLALQQLAELAARIEVPIIAGGGIACADDARAFLALGASAVQVGSAILADPGLPGRIAVELAAQ